SMSLIAVFTPILLMGGLLGRLFREFAVTLSMAILVSLFISLTTTPMLCSLLLKPQPHRARQSAWTRPFSAIMRGYEHSLAWALDNGAIVLTMLLGTIVLTGFLFVVVPKGFFPQQDTGRIIGSIQADQSISFQSMQKKMAQLMSIVKADPAVQSVVGFTGSGSGGGRGGINAASVYVALYPIAQRKVSADQVIARLRHKLAAIPGARLFLQAVQDIHVGGRQSNAQYEYTLQADESAELYKWAPKLLNALQKSTIMTDVNSDQQQKGLETDVTIDRDTASRLGVTPYQIDNTLYDAFGQRQVSTIYSALNQYHVVMEVAPRYWEDPQTLNMIYVSTSGGNPSGSQVTNASVGLAAAKTTPSNPAAIGAPVVSTATQFGASLAVTNSSSSSASVNNARNAATNALANTGHGSTSAGAAVSTNVETMIPLSAFAKFSRGNTPLAVNHQGPFVATTLSFNLAPGHSLSEAAAEIDKAMSDIRMPATIHGSLQGTAQMFEQSLSNEKLLIAAALIAVYIVLGVLYESYIHPITILSTLPSAGVGALLALLVFQTEFSIIALIGVILLIGIVKKNAIMMIDFAVEARREQNMSAYDAIFRACLLRFRPIMMTTFAAILGAIPLALSFGDGGEIRRPLGISIVGGLIVSQMLTLYTTPVLYLALDNLQERLRHIRLFRGRPSPAPDMAE
ncbi:MAG TPA: efflux RND transporter permease subunit, partial [Methylovirgula sp.]|nr:efflux RND transporter permease subunit [Methylovirgula sp.]